MRTDYSSYDKEVLERKLRNQELKRVTEELIISIMNSRIAKARLGLLDKK